MLAYTPARPDRLAGLQRALAALALAALLAALLPLALRAPAAPAAPRSAGMPLLVMPTGDPAAPLAAFGVGDGVAFRPDGPSLALGDARIDVRFLGARPGVALAPADRRPGMIGSRVGPPSAWRDQLPTYAAAIYSGLLPGIDLRYDGRAGLLKGTYFVAPHADPAAIRWRYEGAQSLAVDPVTGDLLIGLPGGATLREEAPIAWQELPGGRAPVAASFTLADGVAGFSLGAYDQARPLVIDPALRVGTYLGGSSADYGRGIAVDSGGFIYVVGDFFSSNFLGQSTKTSGSKDVIVLKLTPAGDELVYGFFAGGAGADEGLAIAVSRAGEAFVLVDPGADFPLHNAALGAAPEVGDGVLMKFGAAGELLYSTYLGFGFSSTNTGKAIAFGPDGRLYIAGETYVAIKRLGQLALAEVSPATGAVARSFDPGERYITTNASAVAVGPLGRVYLTGTVGYPFGEFPVTADAFQQQCGARLILGPDKDCRDNAYLMVFSPELGVEYASYLGGSASDKGRGLAVDAAGNAIIVGDAASIDFPLKNALLPGCPFDPELRLCSYDGFATKLSPTEGLIYSTYIASPGEPEAMTFIGDVAVDAAGNAYVAGFSNAEGLPVKSPVQAGRSTGLCLGFFDRFCFDAYVLGLAPDGTLSFGTYLGGALDEYTQDIAVDSAGAIYLTGYSDATNFPTTPGSIQPGRSANYDFFAAVIAPGGGGAPGPTPGPARPYRVFLPSVRR